MCRECSGSRIRVTDHSIEVHDDCLCRCGRSSEYEVADHLIKPMGCEHFILLVIAVVVVVIEEIVSGGWVLDPFKVASASY